MPNKLEKFAELNTFSNTLAFHHFDIPNGFAKKGKWHEDMFKNQNPIVLELGCGLGMAGIALAKAGASVTCTDLPNTIPMISQNIFFNIENIIFIKFSPSWI